MAAALKTLELLEADGSFAMKQMQAAGRQLTDGLLEQAARHGVGVKVTGPPAMPIMYVGAFSFLSLFY